MSLPSRSTELITLLVGRLPLDGLAMTVLLPSDRAVSAEAEVEWTPSGPQAGL